MLRKESGITLVALVITIIILIILAAVSISAIINSNLITTAQNGVANYIDASVTENQMMSNVTSYIDSMVNSVTSMMSSANY